MQITARSSYLTLISLIALWVYSTSAVAINAYEFADETEAERFQALTYELRCLVCQNQNLADSNAPLAKDLKNEIYSSLQKGKTNDEIIDFMIQRYGEFVLYNPRLSVKTGVLWFGPLLVLVLTIILLWRFIRKNQQKETLKLKREEKEVLKKLID